MTDENTQEQRQGVRNRRVHLANERTFLAWIRTSVAIMGFGFVVEKFALFLTEITEFLSKSNPEFAIKHQYETYSNVFGIVLVGLGALMGIVSFIRYVKVDKQIDEGCYRPSVLLNILLAITVLSIGIFLVIYLIHSM